MVIETASDTGVASPSKGLFVALFLALLFHSGSSCRCEYPNETIRTSPVETTASGGETILQSSHAACRYVDFVCPGIDVIYPAWNFNCSAEDLPTQYENDTTAYFETKGKKRDIEQKKNVFRGRGGSRRRALGKSGRASGQERVRQTNGKPGKKSEENQEKLKSTVVLPESNALCQAFLERTPASAVPQTKSYQKNPNVSSVEVIDSSPTPTTAGASISPELRTVTGVPSLHQNETIVPTLKIVEDSTADSRQSPAPSATESQIQSSDSSLDFSEAQNGTATSKKNSKSRPKSSSPSLMPHPLPSDLSPAVASLDFKSPSARMLRQKGTRQ